MNKVQKNLWVQAVKWPLYSVVIIPILNSAAYNLNSFNSIKIINLITFTFSSILILFWENLTNDLFDSSTGIDEFKFHSIVNLVKNKKIIILIAYLSLFIGLFIIYLISLSSSIKLLYLVLSCCFLGYLYQGPPFRLGYLGLGEPLCWIAFGPLAHAASLMATGDNINYVIDIPWRESFLLGAGQGMAITLVLFCSHFHQVKEDKKYGKNSPLVLIGTEKGAIIVPWIISIIYIFEVYSIYIGFLPPLCFLFLISFPHARKLINTLNKSHNRPNKIKNIKYLAIKFQTLNGLGLIAGMLLFYFIK